MSNSENNHLRNAVYRHSLQGVALGLLFVLLGLAITFPYLPQLLSALPSFQRLALLILFVLLGPVVLGVLGLHVDRLERLKQDLQARVAQLESQEQENRLQEASRTQLEKILERGKREWEGIFDAVQNAILVTDSNGTIIRCNRSAIQWLNNRFDQVIDRSIDSLDLGELDGRAIRLPESAGETYIPSKGGWYDISRFTILLDEDNQGSIYIIQDINRRKNDEAIIREQKDYLETLVELSPAAIVTLDMEKRILSTNPYFETLFGHSREEALGQTLDALVRHDSDQIESSLTPDIPARGEIIRSAVRLQRKDGSQADVEAVGVQLVQGDQVKGALWLYHDISELVQARRAAEQADRAKSEFLANMSHEIRTPMNGIIGMIELAMDTELSDEQYDYLEGARESADALLSVLNSVLDFSKIESGQLALDPVDFDLVALVEGVAQMMANRAETRGLELLAYIDPAVPARVRGDPVRLRQVLVNLVDNALKFTEKGEIVIRCLPETQGHNPLVKFSVSDSGIGIPRDRQADIFERFVQVDGSTTRKYGGTGLGLAISKQLANLMGGEIGVDSQSGKGSTFWFTAALEELPKPASYEPPTTRDLKRMRVLIVDDSAINRQIFTKMMEALGCQVTAVSSGQDVIPALFRGLLTNAHFHLVLLDMQMPGMDGEETLRAIRNEPLTRDTRVVVMTSMGRRTELSKLDALGYSGFLQKPIKQSQLQSMVEYALGLTPHLDTRQRVDALHAEPDSERQLEILVVEDNEINQKMVRTLLSKRGHLVDVAASGREALTAALKKRYDAILMDVQMPDLDGFQASRQIRADAGPNQQTPIIAMTAHVMPGDRQRCLEAGMVDYVSKPIDTRKLFQILERWTSQPAAPAESQSPRARKAVAPPDTILDIKGALKRFSDDRDFYQSLLDEFLQSLPAKMAELQAAFASGDLKQLAFLAHNLKGVAANFGAGQLYGLFASLDDASKKQDAETAGLILADLETAAEKIKLRAVDLFKESQK